MYKLKNSLLTLLFIFIIAVSTYLSFLPKLLLLVIGLPIGYFVIKSDRLFIIAFIYTFVIDSGNGLLPIPLREILFLVLLIKLFLNWKKGFRDKHGLILFTIAVLLPVYGFLISLYRGNNITFALSDSQGYLFLITGIGLYSLIYFKPYLKHSLLKHFLISSGLVAISTLILLLAHITNIFSLDDTRQLLVDHNLGFAGIETNGSYRIFLRSHIYVAISLVISLGFFLSFKMSFSKRIINLLFITICITSLVVSNTRALLIGCIIGLFVYLIGTKITKRYILFIYSLFFLSLPVFMFFMDKISTIFERVLSAFDFNNDLSNSIRSEQARYLIDEFLNYPILGKGFGATLDSGYTRSAEIPYSFELSYLELLYKLGLFGFAIFLACLLMFFFVVKSTSDLKFRKILIASLLVFFFISFSNPYIVSSLGMFLLSILYAYSRSNHNKEATI